MELTVENLAFGGRGLARSGGLVVFVEGAVPGDRVRARIGKRKPQYAEARAIEILEPSPDRIAPRCTHFGACGGCRWQHLPVEVQLRHKEAQVRDALRHIGGQSGFEMAPIVASPEAFHYRNKMEFSFARPPGGALEIGLHRAGDFRQIVDVTECHIQPADLNDVVGYFRAELEAQAAGGLCPAAPYERTRQTGFHRHLIFRRSHATGDFLAAMITASGAWPGVEEFARGLMERFPRCRGFQWGVFDGVGDVARMDELKFASGEPAIEEHLGGLRFRVSAFSFFQTNTAAAERLYGVVREFAELTGRERLLDAYCGTGSIGLFCADAAAAVTGIEAVESAVDDARHNAELNGIGNCTFLCGDMRAVLEREHLGGPGAFGRIIVDPPRGGMEKRALKHLLELAPPLLVYVSCNPTTLARDAVQIAEAGYRAARVQPLDLFPHTYHVECVVQFVRN